MKPETLGLVGRIAYWTVAVIVFLPMLFGDCIGAECQKTDFVYTIAYWVIAPAIYLAIAFFYRSALPKDEGGSRD